MGKLGKFKTVKLTDPEKENAELKVKVKRWSVGKLFSLVRQSWDHVGEAIDGIKLSEISEIEITQKILEVAIKSDELASSIIEESTVEDDHDAEWSENLYPDDFVLLLAEILEMNITGELVKNSQRLLKAFNLAKGSVKKEVVKEAKKSENLTPET